MANITVHCPRWHSDAIYRHGVSAGHPSFRYKDCRRVFQLNYTCKASAPGVKEQIVDMAFNGAGVRGTARTLKMGLNTVLRTLKNSSPKE